MKKYLRISDFAVLLAGLTGCGGEKSPKTYAVEGRVALAGGDPAALAGHYIETAKPGESGARTYAVIEPDGRFKLESMHLGDLKRGAGRQLRGPLGALGRLVNAGRTPVAAKYLQFKSSGMSLQVPPKGDVTLTMTVK